MASKITSFLDKQNIEYTINDNIFTIKLDNKGSVMILSTDRNFMILYNDYEKSLLEEQNHQNIVLLKHSIKNNYLLFRMKKNHKDLYKNFMELSFVYYKLDYDQKNFIAENEEIPEELSILI